MRAQRPLWPPGEHLPLLVVSVWLIISSVSVLETKTRLIYLLNDHVVYLWLFVPLECVFV